MVLALEDGRSKKKEKKKKDEDVGWRLMRMVVVAMMMMMMMMMLAKAGGAQEEEGLGNNSRNNDNGNVSRRTMEAEFMRWVASVGWRQQSRARGGGGPSSTSSSSWLVASLAVAGAAGVRTAPIMVYVDGRGLGPGHFSSIQAAVDSIPDNNPQHVKIVIAPGTYTEKVLIPRTKPFITLEGSGPNSTVVQWSDTANMLGADGTPIGTFKTATVGVDAPYFIAKNITFKNTASLPAIGSNDEQAVALRISGDAAVFLSCHFIGTQDTLYDHKGRHYFQDCYIAGSMDFIFGDGLSMYKNCHLNAIGAPYQEALAAQARDSPQDDTGFSFVNCRVTGSGIAYLGRAWGTFSRVVYSYTYLDTVVIPKGWNDWGDPKRQSTVYFGQFRCYGPGANATGRVSWSKELSAHDALPFLQLSFIDGT